LRNQHKLMTENPLVSIIIPTYNRAHLIGETLDSVLAQTYENWECIIVDDGSTDHTDEVVGKYVKKDKRFKYFHRPDEHLPGGNGARNYGFKMSQGKYVNWFDSDDMMLPEKLELKVKAIQDNGVDFVVSKTTYFNSDNRHMDSLYKGLNSKIKPHDYCAQKVNWLTPDALILKNTLKDIRFNENLKSGQEFNFFCRYMQTKPNFFFIDRLLTHRRHHDDSIKNSLSKDQKKLNQQRFEKIWFTYKDIKKDGTKKSIGVLIYRCISLYYKKQYVNLPVGFYKEVIKQYGFKAILLIPLSILRHFKKGYFLLQKFKPSYYV